MKRELNILSHTHWDREWYLSHARHNYRLVKFFDSLIFALESSAKFKHFHLDGQIAIIEDYLLVRPEMEERIKKLVAERRLAIGPFYVLQDEYLINGESNVRNLLYGLKKAKRYGLPCKIGYFPDAFGNISQMPQILQGFGIDNAFFGRGINCIGTDNQVLDCKNGVPSEIIWKGADGSEVIGVQFVAWYNNCMELPADEAFLKQRLDNVVQMLSEKACTPYLLGMNGCDHQPIQENIGDVIETANAICDYDVIHISLEEYLEKIKPYRDSFYVYQGEIAGQDGKGYDSLVNTASARTDIKILSHKAEHALQAFAEPLSVIGMLNGIVYDQDILEYVNVKILKSFAHDSICSCSCDEVNEKVKLRLSEAYDVAISLGEDVKKALVKKLNTQKQKGACIAVFNTDVKAVGDVVKATIEYRNEEDIPQNPVLRDETGKCVAASFSSIQKKKKFVLPYDSFRKVYTAWEQEVEFFAEIPQGLSARTYYVQNGASKDAEFSATERCFENRYIRVSFRQDGTFELLNKEDGKVYKNQNAFELCYDDGNEYNFKGGGEKRLLNENSARGCLLSQDSFKAVYQATILADGLEIISLITLYGNSRKVSIKTKVINGLKNIRVRACFESNPQSKFVYADGQFNLIKRSIQPGKHWENPDNAQRMNALCLVGKDEGHGVLVATKGLYEYEVYRDGKNTLAITLLRAVGEMGDWFYFPTPDSQMQGTFEYEYSVIPFTERDTVSAVDDGYNFSYPKLTALQENNHEGKDALVGLDMKVDGLVALSSVKKAEDSEDVIVRVYNPSSDTAKITCTRAFDIVDLAEKLLQSNISTAVVEPKKILTLKIKGD